MGFEGIHTDATEIYKKQSKGTMKSGRVVSSPRWGKWLPALGMGEGGRHM